MRRTTMLFAGAIGAALVLATALQARGRGPAGSRAVGPAPANAADRHVAAEGRVVAYPGGEVVVAAERSGRLVRMLVEESARVRRGDLIAEVDADETAAELGEARARVAEAEAELRLAEADLSRREGLARQEIVSARDLDQARRDVEAGRARRETALAAVARFEALLRQSRIRAPITGTVITRHAHAGEWMEPGQRLVTIADLSRLRIEGEADEADSGALAPGAIALITADGWPGRTWKGRVEEIPDAVTLRRLKPQDPGRATDTRILALKVAFAEPTPLKLGTTVELRIAADPSAR